MSSNTNSETTNTNMQLQNGNASGSRGGSGGGSGGGSASRRSRGGGNRMNVKFTVRVPVTPEYIGAVVGKGGNTVTKIKSETDTQISLFDPRPGKGHLCHCFSIMGNSRNSVDHAERWILRIIANTYRQDHPDEFQDGDDNNGLTN